MSLSILYEDDDLLIVDKPSGIPCYPLKPEESDTVAHFLIDHCPQLKGLGDDLREAGLVHRLDNETSGVLVAAKNATTYKQLRQAFSQNRVNKDYLAIVQGQPPQKGKIVWAIGKHPKSQKRVKVYFQAAAARQAGAQEALTTYEVIQQFPEAALLKINIKTGRRHQIRAHLAALGHPLLGDAVYGKGVLVKAPRLMLHATRIALDHPKKEKRISIEAPEPKEFNQFQKLR